MIRSYLMLGCIVIVAGLSAFLVSQVSHTDIEAPTTIKFPSLTGMALEGQTAFRTSCSSCHGTGGTGTEYGPPLIHKIYKPSHHGDGAFWVAVRNGVRAHHWQFGNMPPQADVSDKEITSIIAYVRAVQRYNNIR
ncbi:c-type cytochrome [Coralliovum pocilloporae]|uniref:c-type cytochrome n=1 Tax=Coralliovum pocilloporae TaxID=3066369 RepID=UPI0033073EA5